MLTIENIDVYYEDMQALWDVSFVVQAKEIVVLVGANGAGKSTTLKTISGLLRPRHGNINFETLALNKTAADEIIKHGIVHVPEGRRLFQ
jgi:branched-chain amino acid transport system ATP-binding protein